MLIIGQRRILFETLSTTKTASNFKQAIEKPCYILLFDGYSPDIYYTVAMD